jgi:serine phosphatase RsbU (regulator of sigma subunit)
MGLGIVSGAAYEASLQMQEVPVLPGDVLLLYTDGLVEAQDAQGGQFGIERLIQSLEASQGYSPAIIMSQLAGTLDEFTGGTVLEDDLTAVCVRFK